MKQLNQVIAQSLDHWGDPSAGELSMLVERFEMSCMMSARPKARMVIMFTREDVTVVKVDRADRW